MEVVRLLNFHMSPESYETRDDDEHENDQLEDAEDVLEVEAVPDPSAVKEESTLR